MNLNAIRKDYKTLTLIERNALFISALQRNDKSEIDAIYAATPRKTFSEIDFYELKQNLIVLQMIVIIEKMNHFNLALIFSKDEDSKHKGMDSLSLYLFFTLTDAWKETCKEIGVDADAFERMLFPNDGVLYRIGGVENSFRELAFTEADATAFCTKHGEFNCTLSFTLKNKVAEFRNFLNLPKK